MHENPWQCGCRACLEDLKEFTMANLAIEMLTDKTTELVNVWRRITLAEIERKLEKLNERTNAEH